MGNSTPDTARPTYVAVLDSGSFTVGEANQLSGLFVSDGLDWRHSGWPNVRCFGVAVRPEDTDHILLACGNGVHESRDGGVNWRILTGWQVTEVLDVAFDPNDPDHLLCASAYGVWHSEDAGRSWELETGGMTSPFTQTIVTSKSGGSIWAGTESGAYRASLTDLTWRPDGLSGFAIRQIAVTENGFHVAATRSHGVWIRHEGGSWIHIRGVPPDATCYAVAVNPFDGTIAVGGLFEGVYISNDGGQSARHFISGAPHCAIHALAFDSERRLLVGTTNEGLFSLEGDEWNFLGLPGTSIRRIL